MTEKANTKLRDLAEQLLAIAKEQEPSRPPSGVADTMLLVRLAEALYRNRLARQDEFPSSFFGEPAWDMLLHLFIEEHYGRDVLVKHACLAANAPQTTAIRIIDLLESEGFARRLPDTVDRRRLYVELTEKGRQSLTRMLMRSYRVFCNFSLG